MGTVRVRFFAHLKETVGKEEVTLTLSDPSSLKQLLAILEETLPSTKSIQNSPIRIALNQEIVEKDILIQSGDEIAFLPPFSGG